MDAQQTASFPIPEPDYDENGVDLSLIRAMLAASPLQRLQAVFELATWLKSIGEPYDGVPIPPQHRVRFLELLNRPVPRDP